MIKVKPLVWTSGGPFLSWLGHVDSSTGPIVASLSCDRLLDEPRSLQGYKLWVAPLFEARFGSEEEAKKEAQIRWEAFISSTCNL